MSRKGRAPKREVYPDPIYGSKRITKLINKVMIDGKKGAAQNIVYKALQSVEENTGKEAIEMFNVAIENIMPALEVRGRRVGGSIYQVPVEVRTSRRETLGIRWLVNYSRDRDEKTMAERLAKEIMDAANNSGKAVKKKEDTHKMAEANKAFAHFRW